LPIKLFSQLAEVLTLAAMAVLLPLSPLTCALLSGRLHYLQQYGATVVQSARYLRALGHAHVVSRNLQRKLTPRDSVDVTIEGSCTHCGRCCVNRSCVFLAWLADGRSQCSIYNNWFWRLTSCGSYPLDAPSIATYGCPSYRAVPIRVVARLKTADRH
jgi:hypothetical protein